MMRPLGRRVRRWLRRFYDPVGIWFHPAYRLPIPPAHLVPGMSARRAEDALTWALDLGIVAPEEVHEAPEVDWEAAALAHDSDYLDDLDDQVVVARILGVEPALVSVPNVLEMWRRSVGASLEATRWARRHRARAINLSGGYHHAAPARGAGFCALNDVAIAVRCLRAEGFGGRVVVVDLDAHPPDGIVESLGDDPSLTVLSASIASHWDLPPTVRATLHDQRVEPGMDTAGYLRAVDALLEHLPRSPDLAFYLAGADPLDGDPLGGLAVSEAGLRRRDRRVFRALGNDVPTVVLAAGGYTPGSWRVLAGTVAEATGARAAVQDGYDPVFRRVLDVSRELDPHMLGQDDWLSEEELLESMGVPVRSRQHRFLGFYTRHGLERAFTAHGYLPTLRRMGFQGLAVEVDPGDGADRMQITAQVRGAKATLVDLSASIRPVDRYRTLFVEWLELRDPRVVFTSAKPRLPGQRAPGLGIAEETLQLLARAAGRLDLDGVAFIPAHYHVAWMGRHRFVVLDPERRGHFRALMAYLQGIPLVQASQQLDGPGIPTRDGEPVSWHPSEMVLPISEGLQTFLEEGESVAAAAAAALAARLAPRGSVFAD